MPGRHRRPSRARKAMIGAVTGATAISTAAIVSAAPASAAGDPFASIRQCESGGNYATNTGNGFYGAYQFSQSTWSSLGYPGRPDQASPAVQDQAARQLAARSGFGQWPVCGAGFGSYSGSTQAPAQAPAVTYSAPQQQVASTSAPSQPVAVIPAAVGPWPNTMFTTNLVHMKRADVLYWQKKMRKLGYHIKADGQFGPQSQAAAEFFQWSHGLVQDGVVGPKTWLASVTAKK